MKKHPKVIRTSIKADVIVLGCTLPGIVTAHKLKKRFGDTMDIVVLDLQGVSKVFSKCNVAFKEDTPADDEADFSDEAFNITHANTYEPSLVEMDSIAKHYLIKYTSEFKIPIPVAIINPTENESSLDKLFEYCDGTFVRFNNRFHDFKYLNFLEKFELNQYQNYLDRSMKYLFGHNTFNDPKQRQRLLYYDQTSMETNICQALLFSTSRDIMRTTVKLVCGAPADTVSLLFYLHQCYRTSGPKNHLDGQNTRLRERLIGHCRIRLWTQLRESVADITMPAKAIKNIRTYNDADAEHVMLETMMGETTYVCSLLAMALKPDQLQKIQVENGLLPDEDAMIAKDLTPGRAKKFLIQYEESFWEQQGFSGDILSIRGPIVWAMERPRLSCTGSVQKYAALIGYLMVEDDETDSKEAVLQQLVSLYGEEAGSPVTYRESSIADIFIPRCGNYVGLRVLTNEVSPRGLEWGAFDVFADGDVAAALEAGHLAYLHLVSCLRPQAQTYEDISATDWPTVLNDSPLPWWFSRINVVNTIKITICTTALVAAVTIIRSYIKRN